MKIAIYFSAEGQMGYPFSDPDYFNSYRQFAYYCQSRGMDIYFVRGQSYQGQSCFSSAWQFKEEEGEQVLIEGPLQVDLIYVKGSALVAQLDPADQAINSKSFYNQVAGKLKTYQTLGQYMAYTSLITAKNWKQVIEKIPSQLMVLKPVNDFGGHGVFFCKKEEFNYADHQFKVPYLAQEFIDTSFGAPDLVKGKHDIRLLLFDNEVKLGYIRQPVGDSLLANYSQGATGYTIPATQIPSPFIELALKIDQHFKEYSPRFYSLDFLCEKNKIYLGELNLQPGFLTEKDGYMQEFHQYFYTLLKAYE